MRRLGIIVALGALLSLFAGVVTAVPALAGRGDGWQLGAIAPETIPADVCGFAVYVNPVAFKGYTKELKASDGTAVFLSTGTLKIAYTNLDTGKTITENASGPGKVTAFPDGSATVDVKGLNAFRLPPAIAAAFGLPQLFVSAGPLTLTFDPDGNLTSVSLTGHVKVDVCAALS